ncbi:MAG TPA: hypothetical protein VF006_28615 [Longimicrobium sp.]|nr:hypothetical protein [Longimicrobium sp.]
MPSTAAAIVAQESAIPAATQDAHCEFTCDGFDYEGTITCNLDGETIVSSRDVLWLSRTAWELNQASREEYVTNRDFIRAWY